MSDEQEQEAGGVEEHDTITVSKRNSPDKVVLQYVQPTTIEGWIEKFDEEGVTDVLNSAFYQRLQNIARIKFDEGKDAMQAAIDSWVPGHRATRTKKTPLEAAKSLLHKLSPEDAAALLQQIQLEAE